MADTGGRHGTFFSRGTFRHESIRHETFRIESIRHETFRIESIRHETFRHSNAAVSSATNGELKQRISSYIRRSVRLG